MKIKLTVSIITVLLFCAHSIHAVSLISSASQKDFTKLAAKTSRQKKGEATSKGHKIFNPLISTGAGSLDNTFGTNGTLMASIDHGQGSANDYGKAVAIQSDGKIVIAGYSDDSTSEDYIVAARFNSNGTIDSTFGIDGWAKVSINGEAKNDFANSVAIQSDGKIVLAGYSIDSSQQKAFAVARLNSNGVIDSSFGNNGSLGFFIAGGDAYGDEANSVAIQSDGKIVIAGYSGGHFFKSFYQLNRALAVVRLNSDGSFDNTFGLGGQVRIQILKDSTSSIGNAALIQYDGKIVVAGNTSLNNITYVNVTRLNADGSLDNTFGTNGTNLFSLSGGDTTVENVCNSAALQNDGKIVLGGYYSGGSNFALARVNTNGSLDSSFGLNGSEIVPKISQYGYINFIGSCVEIQSDGKILEGGNMDDNNFTLACFNPNGTIDSTFGSNGWALATTDSSNHGEGINAITIDQDGKIVTAGYSINANNIASIAAARFLSQGISAVSAVKQLPKSFSLSQNYPNPFNPTTIINYQIPNSNYITLKVYDILGNVIKTLVDGYKTQGKHSVNFNAGNLASGVYFYQLHERNFITTKKLLLLK